MRASSSAATIDTSAQGRSVAAPAVLAAFLGVFLLWGVGFSHNGAIHNAAHDTRHSNAFPCH